MKRRTFLNGIGAILAAPSIILQPCSARALSNDWGFPFGIASGDPTHDSMVLWTRLASTTGDFSPVANQPVNVAWAIATDPHMRNTLQRGIGVAHPAFGHSVHINVQHLQPDQDYYYTFRCGMMQSPIGKTRTLPAPDSNIARFRFNVVSCQNWEQGWFSAYDGMVEDNPAFVLHLGDYIYEISRGNGVRQHETRQTPRTLADYRARHALYKTDPSLQQAHARYPFVLTLDNHDALYDNTSDPAELKRRAAAYQAWYEFQPVRFAPQLDSAAMQIRRSIDIGRLLRLNIPDTRQFRDTETPCANSSDPTFAFGVYERNCAAVNDPRRSMLGAEQEAWLSRRLQHSEATWNIIATTVKMTPFDMQHHGELYRYLQSWDGYPAERNRLLDRIVEAGTHNPVSLSGDIHSFLVSRVVRNVGDHPRNAPMTELVGTSISSLWPEPLAAPMRNALSDNPHVNYFDSEKRGYLRCTFTPDECLADLRTISSALQPSGLVGTSARFVIHNGLTGAERI